MIRGLSSVPSLPSSSRMARWVTAAMVCLFLLGVNARVSPAQDLQSARREITKADDFRVRLGAALLIGRTKPPDGRALLEKALSDPHPAVRAAAAAALGSYNDTGAIPALEQHLATEGTPSVRTQIESSLNVLRVAASGKGGGSKGTKYIVQLGSMRTASGVGGARGDQLGQVLRAAARERAASVPGAFVAPDPQTAARRGLEQHLPVLVIDGTLVRMSQQSQNNGTVGFSAQVDFSVRKVPEHSLRASLTGNAMSIGTARSLGSERNIAALQDQAVDGAVESAMRNADRGFTQALQ
ncbi:HEAT repeat domain-containing protein [Pendulispora albinea]|uniref:HEAT repeat domain-containing protein n=1 Tax=Pendulispora albinea TaxID=2741071 RepID=A0ABZ2M260_9BACT